MPFVLDACVTAGWHFEDEANPVAAAALDALARDAALVPAHWWFEIRNVVLMGERRGRTSPEQAGRFLALLRTLPIRPAALPDDASVLEIARRRRSTFYDAVYLELALRENVALATLDRALAAAATAEGVRLLQPGT